MANVSDNEFEPFAAGGYLSFKLGARFADIATPPIPDHPVSAEEVASIRLAIAAHRAKTLERLKWFSIAFLGISIVCTLIQSYALAAIFASLALPGLAHGFFPEIVTAETGSAATYFLMIIFGSLFVGVDNGKGIYTRTNATDVIKLSEGDVEGSVVRSGERGLLFFDRGKKKLTFFVWSDVKRITAR